MKAVSGLLKLVSTQYISVNFPKTVSAKPVALLDHKVPHTTSSSIDTKGLIRALKSLFRPLKILTFPGTGNKERKAMKYSGKA